jgi:hypothetical protein
MATYTTTEGGNVEITYYQNDEMDHTFVISDASDLSAKTLLMQIKEYRSDSTPLAELESGDELSVGGAGNKEVTTSGTYDIPSGTYYFDLRNTNDSKTLVYGLVIVTGDVSK